MKKGITVEYNMQEDCYEVIKARGVLNMDEIQEAMTERYGSDEIIFVQMRTGSWDDYLQDIVNDWKSDYVKVYLYDQLKRLMS